MAGLPDHRHAVQAERQDPSRPRLVSVTPANDALAVNTVTELHMYFDRPMDPLSLKLDWESGGFLDCEFPQYDAPITSSPSGATWLRERFSKL